MPDRPRRGIRPRQSVAVSSPVDPYHVADGLDHVGHVVVREPGIERQAQQPAVVAPGDGKALRSVAVAIAIIRMEMDRDEVDRGPDVAGRGLRDEAIAGDAPRPGGEAAHTKGAGMLHLRAARRPPAGGPGGRT